VAGEGIYLSVADDGIGTTKEEVGIALQPFRQVDNTLTRKFEGLGLPLAKALVERHGGRLEITSRPGERTVVTVFLPERHLENTPPAEAGPAPQAVEAWPRPGGWPVAPAGGLAGRKNHTKSAFFALAGPCVFFATAPYLLGKPGRYGRHRRLRATGMGAIATVLWLWSPACRSPGAGKGK